MGLLYLFCTNEYWLGPWFLLATSSNHGPSELRMLTLMTILIFMSSLNGCSYWLLKMFREQIMPTGFTHSWPSLPLRIWGVDGRAGYYSRCSPCNRVHVTGGSEVLHILEQLGVGKTLIPLLHVINYICFLRVKVRDRVPNINRTDNSTVSPPHKKYMSELSEYVSSPVKTRLLKKI